MAVSPSAVSVSAMRRRQRVMRAVNVPMRAVLGLPFTTPLSANLMLISYTGRKTGKAYRQRLLGVIAAENPRAARFVPIPRRPDGRLEPEALDAALRHGFCIVRWHLGRNGPG